MTDHGTPARYSKYDCRCKVCRNAWRLYCKDLRETRRRLEMAKRQAETKRMFTCQTV